mgnify:CR=1 FL=1
MRRSESWKREKRWGVKAVERVRELIKEEFKEPEIIRDLLEGSEGKSDDIYDWVSCKLEWEYALKGYNSLVFI